MAGRGRSIGVNPSKNRKGILTRKTGLAIADVARAGGRGSRIDEINVAQKRIFSNDGFQSNLSSRRDLIYMENCQSGLVNLYDGLIIKQLEDSNMIMLL
jgi:hypothetical protein